MHIYSYLGVVGVRGSVGIHLCLLSLHQLIIGGNSWQRGSNLCSKLCSQTNTQIFMML